MSGLLPKELLEAVLNETGAFQNTSMSRVVKNGVFHKFDFQPKKRSEFDLSIFETPFDLMRAEVDQNWKSDIFPSCELERSNASLIDLASNDFRKQSFCTRLKTSVVEDGFLIYTARKTFFTLLNHYLGGAEVSSETQRTELTDIEKTFYEQTLSKMSQVISHKLNEVLKVDLEMDKLFYDESSQASEFEDKHLTVEFFFLDNDSKCPVYLSLPSSYLTAIKEKMEQEAGGNNQGMDPLWNKAVTNAFMVSEIDFRVSLGRIEIPFEKSLSLKVGDTFSWDKGNMDAVLFQEETPRIHGTIGVVDENFAVQVQKIDERAY